MNAIISGRCRKCKPSQALLQGNIIQMGGSATGVITPAASTSLGSMGDTNNTEQQQLVVNCPSPIPIISPTFFWGTICYEPVPAPSTDTDWDLILTVGFDSSNLWNVGKRTVPCSPNTVGTVNMITANVLNPAIRWRGDRAMIVSGTQYIASDYDVIAELTQAQANGFTIVVEYDVNAGYASGSANTCNCFQYLGGQQSTSPQFSVQKNPKCQNLVG